MSETITLTTEELDALIERKLAKMQADALAPKRRPTPGCNCNADGFADREMHQFGCPWADPKGELAKRHVAEKFEVK